VKKYLLLLIVAICFLRVERVDAQYVTIPDSNFVTWMQTHGYASCMIGNQLDTTCPAVVNATAVKCIGEEINDLAGIQYFDNLDSLNCV
jgi:hypothetical protein